MRWNVDVSSLDGGAQTPQSYCVEAESWQGALQSARRLRGDESRMAGFSIDITNEGCKAVDPSKKLRYEVKRTADATPLTPGGEAAPPSKKRISGGPPRPTPSASPPAVSASAPPPRVIVPKPEPTLKVEAPPVVAVSSAPSPVTVAKTTAAMPIIIPPIVVSREQEPTAEVPLTYREYGFALPPGTTEDNAAIALGNQLQRIQGGLAAAPAGKLVNLAAFDQMFQGRPPVLPLATLTWKDWATTPPVVSYPRRRAKVVAPPTAAPVSAPPAAAPAPVAVAAPAPVAFPVAVSAPENLVVVTSPVSQPPISQTQKKPPVPKHRIRGDELITVLFESMHDLNFLRDSIEGGDFCLGLALEKLPSRIGLVYLYDIDHREFVIVCASGAPPDGIVGKRFAETEPALSNAMRKRRAILLQPEEIAEHAPHFGGAKSVLLAPVMQAGRFLGAIEIADPADAAPFSELDANAISYMAEQYAEFVAARGVILSRDRISQPPAATTQ
jgi:hypothetical protein